MFHGHSDLGLYPPVGPVGIPRTWLILLLKIVLAGSSPGLVLPYIAYTLRECAAGQGMVFHLSVPKGIWFRLCLSTGYFLQDWFDFLDEFCLFSKYTKAMTMTYRALLQLPINGFKTNGVHFVLCPKQGNKIEGPKQGMYFRKFCPKQGQGQTFSGSPIPKYWSITHPRVPRFSNYGDSWWSPPILQNGNNPLGLLPKPRISCVSL